MTQVMELIPENWDFVVGRQNTCRFGSKWADSLSPGDSIRFECNDGRSLSAKVVRTSKCLLQDLSDDECAANHVYNGREALLAALKRAYGDWFTPEHDVSLIEFETVSTEREPK